MSTTKKIKYNTEDLQQKSIDILENLLQEIKKESIAESLGRELINKINTQGEEIKKRLQGKFSLVIVGDFKRGKSTLINSLVGSPVVTTNVTPETVTINYIEYGEQNKIEAILKDGGIVNLTPEELYAENLEPLIEKLPPIKNLKIETPVEWLQGISLIDTPGTGDLFQRFDRDVHDILEKSDAVIFTISALSPLSLSEQNFLKLSLLPQDFPKVFFVVNMLDRARTIEEGEKLLNSIKTKINNLFPQAQIFGISARDEFCRIQSIPRPNPQQEDTLAQYFTEFRNSLENSILLNRDVIHLSRLVNRIDRYLNYWQSQIILLRNSAKCSQLELAKAITECQDESSSLFNKIKEYKNSLSQEIQNLLTETTQWLNEFLDRIETEAINSIANYQLSEIRRYYNFFLADSIQKAVSSCLDIHRPKIVESFSKAANSIVEEVDRVAQSYLFTPELGSVSLEQQQWTNLDTLQTIMQMTPLGAITDILISRVKETSDTKVISYQNKLQESFPQLRTSILEQVHLIYNDIIQQLESQLDSIYQQEIEASLATLQQAQELGDRGEKEIVETNENLGKALSIFSLAHDDIKDFQSKLWNP